MPPLKESIIKNSIRSFFIALSALLGVFVAIFLGMLVFGIFSKPDITPPKSKVTIAPDAFGHRTPLPASAPVILRLNITGVIGEFDLTQEKFENLLYDSQGASIAAGRVKAILLYINTPGGTATDSDGIYSSLKRYKEMYKIPIHAYVSGLCASGGMFIASSADFVSSSPESMIGSVGVRLGPAFNFTGTMDKYGIKALTLTEGKDKDALNPFRPWKPDEAQSFRNNIEATYERFVDIVTEARPELSRTKLIEEYGAQVFIAKMAEKIGMIDASDGNYPQAVYHLANEAGIPENQPYQVLELSPYHTLFGQVNLKSSPLFTGKIVHSFDMNDAEKQRQFYYLY